MTFNETQKFRQWWLWILLVGASVKTLTHTFHGNIPNLADIRAVEWVSAAVFFLLAILFWFVRLRTVIDQTGIHVTFVPFAFRSQHWTWGEIKRAHIREYKPLLEYGGWGLRYSLRNGRAYSTKGNNGLQLELTNGKKILIGTQQKEELNRVLTYLRQQYRIDAIEITG